MTADGTFKAAVRPLVSHDAPSAWRAAEGWHSVPAFRQREYIENFGAQVISEFDSDQP